MNSLAYWARERQLLHIVGDQIGSVGEPNPVAVAPLDRVDPAGTEKKQGRALATSSLDAVDGAKQVVLDHRQRGPVEPGMHRRLGRAINHEVEGSHAETESRS